MAKYFVLEEIFCQVCCGKGFNTIYPEEGFLREENCDICTSKGYTLEPTQITGSVLAEILEIS